MRSEQNYNAEAKNSVICMYSICLISSRGYNSRYVFLFIVSILDAVPIGCYSSALLVIEQIQYGDRQCTDHNLPPIIDTVVSLTRNEYKFIGAPICTSSLYLGAELARLYTHGQTSH